MSKQKRLVLTDSSVNRYGYRVLTEGCQNLEAFKKNPILLYMHLRDEGTPYWCDYKAIGHWEDIQVDGDQLSAVPVFDCADELSETVKKKFDAGTFNAASIGIRIIATSEEKELLLPGQTRGTVTKWDLLEASIVDIPANQNAVRLYAGDTMAKLAANFGEGEMPALINFKNQVMNLKSTWKTVLAFLGIAEDKAETTQLSAENVDQLDAEMKRLQGEVSQLTSEKATLQGELDQLRLDVQTKDTEISTLKASVQSKDTQINDLNTQVANLKKGPAVQELKVAPGNDADVEDDLATFSADENNDIAALAERMEKEGL